MRIAHVITRLILGGAQQNTLLTAAGQAEDFGDDVVVITGPGIGAEGAAEPEPRRAARVRARDARRKRHHKGVAEKLLLRVVRKCA